MGTWRGFAQPLDCPLTHMLPAYWRKLLAASSNAAGPTSPAPLWMEDGGSVEEGTGRLSTRMRLLVWVGVAFGIIAGHFIEGPS
jgi:hypothetical protein